MTIDTMVLDTPVGHLALRAEAMQLTHCDWTQEPAYACGESPLLSMAADQLLAYLTGKRMTFTIPLKLSGTSFQQAVWRGLCTIPYGQTRSYQQLAMEIGHPRAHRAVGSANAKNRIAIIVPCHRVILASGDLGGFASGISHKQQLLELERHYAQGF